MSRLNGLPGGVVEAVDDPAANGKAAGVDAARPNCELGVPGVPGPLLCFVVHMPAPTAWHTAGLRGLGVQRQSEYDLGDPL